MRCFGARTRGISHREHVLFRVDDGLLPTVSLAVIAASPPAAAGSGPGNNRNEGSSANGRGRGVDATCGRR